MTSPHQDAAYVVAELRSPTTYACVQPTHLHRLDYDKGRQLLNRAANLIEQQAKALGEWKQAAQVEAGLRREFYDRALAAEGRLAEAMRVIEQIDTICRTPTSSGDKANRHFQRDFDAIRKACAPDLRARAQQESSDA